MTVILRIYQLLLSMWLSLSLVACIHTPNHGFRKPTEILRGQISFQISTPAKQITGDAAIAISNSGKTRFEILNPFGMTSALLMIDDNSIKWFDFTDRCYSASSHMNVISFRELGLALTGHEIWEWLGIHPWPEKTIMKIMQKRSDQKAVLSWVGPDNTSLGSFILELPARDMILKLNWMTRETGTMDVFEHTPDRRRFKRCEFTTMQLFFGKQS